MIMRLILILQKLFLNFIPDDRLFVEYARTESQLNYGEPFNMTVVTQLVCVLAIDFRKVIQRQNKNFQTLRSSLIYYNRFRQRTLIYQTSKLLFIYKILHEIRLNIKQKGC